MSYTKSVDRTADAVPFSGETANAVLAHAESNRNEAELISASFHLTSR